jgi:hypothetical protein
MSSFFLAWPPLALCGLLLAGGGAPFSRAGAQPGAAQPEMVQTTTARGLQGVQRFVLDPARSELGFNGTSTLHDFTGRSNALDGVLFTDPARASAFAVGEVVCAAATLDTEDEGRDEKMREHLHADRFPLLAFALESVEPVPGVAADGPWPERLLAEGTFRIHGVERRRSLELLIEPLDASRPGMGVRARGSLRFLMSEHSIQPPVVAVISVGDEVEVFLDLAFQADEPASPGAIRAVRWTETVEPVRGDSRTTAEHALLTEHEGCVTVQRAGGPWLQSGSFGVRTLDLQARALGLAPEACEASFEAARARMRSLEQKLGKLTGRAREVQGPKVEALLEELAMGLRLAPASGSLREVQEPGRREWWLGETLWLRVEEAESAPLALAPLAALPGLPASLRERLATLQASPRTLTLRTALPTGVRTLTLELGAPQTSDLSDWSTAAQPFQGLTPRTASR